MNTRLNPEALLFVGTKGLFKVTTPFIVVCVVPTDIHAIGDHAKVYRVNEGSEHELLYYISKKYYSHHNFQYVR